MHVIEKIKLQWTQLKKRIQQVIFKSFTRYIINNYNATQKCTLPLVSILKSQGIHSTGFSHSASMHSLLLEHLVVYMTQKRLDYNSAKHTQM